MALRDSGTWTPGWGSLPTSGTIHAKLRGVGYTLIHQLLLLLLITAAAVPVILVRVQSQAHAVGIPVIPEGLERLLVYILGKPGQPMGGHAVELIILSFSVHQMRALNPESPVKTHRR